MDILKRIDDLKRERGWSTYHLAQEAAITQSTLTNMYSRNTLPSITTLMAICEAFGLSLSQFFSEEKTTLIPSDDEVELIQMFRKLTEKNKNLIKNLIHGLEQ